MTDAAERFDRRAIREFCESLSAQTGVTATVLCHPEDDSSSPLTVDALLDISGEVWAVDHVRLVYDCALIPAVDDIADRLRSALQQLATEHDRYLIVNYLPPGLSSTASEKGRAGKRAREAERAAFVDKIVGLAMQAVTTGDDRFLHDGLNTVRFALSRPSDGERVHLMAWGSGGTFLDAQVAAGLADALRAKVADQLANAKEAGYRVMLLIDQVQDPASRQPSFFLATADGDATATSAGIGDLLEAPRHGSVSPNTPRSSQPPAAPNTGIGRTPRLRSGAVGPPRNYGPVRGGVAIRGVDGYVMVPGSEQMVVPPSISGHGSRSSAADLDRCEP